MSKTIPIKLYDTSLDSYKPTPYDRDDRYEVVISLFTECNMKCSFCADRNRSFEKVSKSAIDLRFEHFKTLINSRIFHHKHIDIKLFGGELFQDKFSDEVYEWYYAFVDSVESLLREHGITWQWYISSNFIFKNSERPFAFLKRINAVVRCSFDFKGRFTKETQIERFIANVFKAKDYGIEPKLAIIMTRTAIDCIMHRKGSLFKVFEDFYNRDILSEFDYYDKATTIINAKVSEIDEECVDERLLAQFFIHLYENYDRMDLVKSLLDRSNVHYHCCHGATITDKLYYQCCDLYTATQKLMESHNCYMCDYFYCCGGMCNRVFNDCGELCHLKMVYEYIDSTKFSV